MLFRESKPIDIDVSIAKKGDGEAFGRLIHKNKLAMYRIAKSLLQNQHDVEDAIGNAILNAYEKLGVLRKNERFKTWLLKILTNQCYEVLRKKNKELPVGQSEFFSNVHEDKYEDFELLRAINSLEENQRIATILFYYEDISLKDISKILEIPEGTVKSRLNRAKEKLKSMIKE